jgi:hypothetical protein
VYFGLLLSLPAVSCCAGVPMAKSKQRQKTAILTSALPLGREMKNKTSGCTKFWLKIRTKHLLKPESPFRPCKRDDCTPIWPVRDTVKLFSLNKTIYSYDFV